MIPLFKVFMPPGVLPSLERTLTSGYIGQGPQVAKFEKRLVPWVGTRNVAAVNSGTSAIHLALRVSGVGPGDEVITSPMTCVATNQPVLHSGARIVWGDIDPSTGNVCAEDLHRRITSKTKALIVLHWGGSPADLERIHAVASEYGLTVIEDACHAFGAEYHGTRIGSHSHFVCFSFQAVKLVTTGDGGAITCRDEEHLERVLKLRWYGLDRRLKRGPKFLQQDIEEPGYKFHMNDIAATIGLEQLRHATQNLSVCRRNAEAYDQAFRQLKNVRTLREVAGSRSSRWLYTLRVSNRAGFVLHMKQCGIEASAVHARNDLYSIFRSSVAELPGVDIFDREHVCIPAGWWVTPTQVRHIIESVMSYDERGATKQKKNVSVNLSKKPDAY